jgi:purine-binding chemotaxis protein CheW
MKIGFNNKYIKEIGKVGTDIKLLLDSDKLLNDDELDNTSRMF